MQRDRADSKAAGKAPKGDKRAMSGGRMDLVALTTESIVSLPYPMLPRLSSEFAEIDADGRVDYETILERRLSETKEDWLLAMMKFPPGDVEVCAFVVVPQFRLSV